MATGMEIDSVIRGYHIYKEVWTSTVGEELNCRRERDNFKDLFAIAVMKDSLIVGHVPRG